MHTQVQKRAPTFEEFFAARAYLQETAVEHAQPTGGVEEIVSIILGARDESEVTDSLDEAFTSDAFAEYYAAIATKRHDAATQPVGPSLMVLSARQKLFGIELANKLHRADTVWFHVGRIAATIIENAQLQGVEECSKLPGDLVDDTAIPLEYRQLILRTWHGLLASLALNALLQEGKSHAAVSAFVDAAWKGARAAWHLFRGEVSLMAHQHREEWAMKAFNRAAEGDGYFATAADD